MQFCDELGVCSFGDGVIRAPPQGAFDPSSTPPGPTPSGTSTPARAATGTFYITVWSTCALDCNRTSNGFVDFSSFTAQDVSVGKQTRDFYCIGDCVGLPKPDATRGCLDSPCTGTACNYQPCGKGNQCTEVALDDSVRTSETVPCLCQLHLAHSSKA